MLAERKQKVKWSLNPRGNFWTEDENSTGRKMLKQMGWQKGKGLGKYENGRVDHVKVVYKCDNNGIGFDRKKQEWISHQEDFDALLANLNSCYPSAKSEKTADEARQSTSLVERAQHFRSRLHYRKFLRGKDLSQYSEKDIESIIGKKSNSEQNAGAENKAGSKTQQETPYPGEEARGNHGVSTYTSSVSMSDYFKQKLKDKKPAIPVVDLDATTDDYECNNTFSVVTLDDDDSAPSTFDQNSMEKEKKKKKKSKKRKRKNVEMEENCDLEYSAAKKVKVDNCIDSPVEEPIEQSTFSRMSSALKSCLKKVKHKSLKKCVKFCEKLVSVRSISPIPDRATGEVIEIQIDDSDDSSQGSESDDDDDDDKEVIEVIDLEDFQQLRTNFKKDDIPQDSDVLEVTPIEEARDEESGSCHEVFINKPPPVFPNPFWAHKPFLLGPMIGKNNEAENVSSKPGEKVSHFAKLLRNIEKHDVLSTTNLLSIKGYGN